MYVLIALSVDRVIAFVYHSFYFRKAKPLQAWIACVIILLFQMSSNLLRFMLMERKQSQCILFDVSSAFKSVRSKVGALSLSIQYFFVPTVVVLLANATIAYKAMTRRSLARRPADVRRDNEMTRCLIYVSAFYFVSNVVTSGLVINVYLHGEHGLSFQIFEISKSFVVSGNELLY